MKQNWIKWTAIAAAFVLVLTGGILMTTLITRGAGNAVVALDVNPSLEIEVNDKEQVVEVRALNEDAQIVVGDMNFSKVDLDIAINALIGSMLQNGYISTEQNSILISVDSGSQKKADQLKERVSTKVTALLEGSEIEASIITQTFDKSVIGNGNAATNNGNQISSARASLIEKILSAGLADAGGVPYTYDQLAMLKVHDLKLILESKGITVDGIQSSGTASDGKLIGNERALEIAYEKAGVTADAVTRVDIEIDVSKKTQTIFYEIEFKSGGFEYEYEMIAATGEIIKEEIEADDGGNHSGNGNGHGGEHGNGNGNGHGAPVGNEYIAVKEALDIAYAHAQVAVADVRDKDCEFKVKNGKPVYEVEFEVGKRDYDYIIDAVTGDILRATCPSSADDATASAAEELALTDAGVERSNARELKTVVEYRDGIVYGYLVEFETRGDMEYEYSISADGTEILNKKVDD